MRLQEAIDWKGWGSTVSCIVLKELSQWLTVSTQKYECHEVAWQFISYWSMYELFYVLHIYMGS